MSNRFIFLSVLFLLIGVTAQAQTIKPKKVLVEKKAVSTVKVERVEVGTPTKTKKGTVNTKLTIQYRETKQKKR